MHEIVTLQFGQRANYLGTHFWNTQESYFTYGASDSPSLVNHDICFRPGIGSDGADTYTPRAMVYDLKSGFGSLRKINALYETTDDQSRGDKLWANTQHIQTAPPITPSPYQVALETGAATAPLKSKDVRYWSDYNRIFFHPRSLVQLSAQSLTSQLAAFESYSAGVELFKNLDQEAGGLLDRDVRLFAEECDSLQGFQIFGASDDAWGGFMSQYVEDLREEYGKKSVWVWGIEDGRKVERTKLYTKLANSAHSLAALTTNATAYIPVSTIPSRGTAYTHVEPESEWSTGALLSSVIESATLPTRLRQSRGIRPSSMAMFDDLLGGSSKRNIWQLQARASPVDDQEASDSSQDPNMVGDSTSDTRMNRTQGGRAQISLDDATADVQPSSFDLNFTPSLPQVQDALPSLRASRFPRRPRSHLFAQVESNRYSANAQSQSFSQNLSRAVRLKQDYHRQSYNDEPVVEIYNTPLAYPLLDSFPQNLFTWPSYSTTRTAHDSPQPTKPANSRDTNNVDERGTINVSAALSTTSSTKLDLLALRDLVVGRAGRALGLVDINEREAMYDDLSKLTEDYTYGFEDDDDDLIDGEDEGDYDD